MAELTSSLRAYGLLASMWIRATMTYRASFAMMTTAQFLVTLIDFVAILIMFSQITDLGGFSLSEIALLYGVSCLALGVAHRDLSLVIEAGEMVGYIGPNGAGKSTTIKMLTGILVPSAGELTVLGLPPSAERTKLARRIEVVFGQRTTLWWDLPLRDSFDLLRRIYRVPEARFRANTKTFTDLLDLHHRLRSLS